MSEFEEMVNSYRLRTQKKEIILSSPNNLKRITTAPLMKLM